MPWKMSIVIVAMSGVLAGAQVVTSEFYSDPVSEGWDIVQIWCEPETWNENGVYYQVVDFEPCGPPPPPGGDKDSYVRNIDAFNGAQRWFYEFRVWTNGDRSEIVGGCPTALAAGNFYGENYLVNVARDQVKFDSNTPGPHVFVDVEEGPHTIRLELNNEGTPTYKWFLDGVLIDEGIAPGPFPSDDARLTWRGKAWYLPAENRWYFIRYGVPSTSPGDFDSDGDIDQRDAFYFAECVSDRGNGPNVPADPGCVDWADLDGDGDIDFADMSVFQRMFTGDDE